MSINEEWGKSQIHQDIRYMSTVKEQGIKYDQDKSRVDLLDAEFLESVGHVLGFGARKYAANNWRGGISVSRLLGSTLRHVLALMRGERLDPESGLPHTAHLGCNAMFLHWMLKNREDLDDRYFK
jgi:hypothetical protein